MRGADPRSLSPQSLEPSRARALEVTHGLGEPLSHERDRRGRGEVRTGGERSATHLFDAYAGAKFTSLNIVVQPPRKSRCARVRSLQRARHAVEVSARYARRGCARRKVRRQEEAGADVRCAASFQCGSHILYFHTPPRDVLGRRCGVAAAAESGAADGVTRRPGFLLRPVAAHFLRLWRWCRQRG